jgi:hypothetical protein
MTTALIATPSPNDTDAQLQAVAAEQASKTPGASLFPKVYIIAPMPKTRGSREAVFNLETAPPKVFDGWLYQRCVEAKITHPDFIAKVGSLDWTAWSLADRWTAIEALAKHLAEEGKTLPLYESKAAAQAVLIAKEAQAQHSACNESEAVDEQP